MPPARGRRAAAAAAVLGAAVAWAAHATAPTPAAVDAASSQAPSAADRVAAACRTTNPYVAVVVQARGLTASAHAALPAVVAVRDTAAGEPPERIVLATAGQVGAVYGLAYDPAGQALFAAAHVRRGAAFGPGGPGMVYRIDLASGEVAPWQALAAGADVHNPALAADPLADDTTARRFVGQHGLGDIARSGDGTALHVANLFDRHIVTLSLTDGRVLGRFRDRDRRDQFDAALRPFAVAGVGDEVWYGVTDGFDPDYPPRPKAALVYAAAPDGAGRRTVGYADWTYGRTPPWTAWTDRPVGDQPLLAGLALRPGGGLVLGWRDRSVDMAPERTRGDETDGPSVGDLRATTFQGLTWRASAARVFDVTGAAGRDAAFGAVAALPGLDVVVAPTLPLAGDAEVGADRLALAWFDAASGRRVGTEVVYDAAGAPDKAPDLAAGDVEVLCGSAAPDGVDIPGTATAVGAPVATATAAAAQTAAADARARTATAAPTVLSATQTAHAPTEIARATDARATATAMAPAVATIDARRPTAAAAGAGTATAASARWATAAPRLAARLAATPLPTRSTARSGAVVLAQATIRAADASDNPYLAVANHVPWLDGGGREMDAAWWAGEPVVIAFNDSEPEDATTHLPLAWNDELGSVFGIAADIAREQVYAGAFLKRITRFGPLGPGGIYRLDLRTGRAEPFAVLDAGADPHDDGANFDVASANFVGRVGLGDLELAVEDDVLLAVNLYDRLIYRFGVPDGRPLGAFPVGALAEARPTDVLPFGLGWHDRWLYHGVVIDGATPQAVVYRSRHDGTDMAEVSRMPLDYPRQPAWEQGGRGSPTGAEPWLVDLEFRNDGDLVLGLRDRAGDRGIGGVGSGDIVLTTRVGDRFVPLPAPELYDDTILHAETAFGSLAALPWLDQVVSTAVDPQTVNSNGTLWYDNRTGAHVRRETIHAGLTLTFAKAAGLGDMESLNVAPTPTYTPTPTDAVTRTPTPSPTNTAPPSPTVTPTATTAHHQIYLPVAQRRHCVPFETRTDVVLVLDMSTSMNRLTRGNRSKHDAAVDAARAFVGLMRFTPDTAGRRDRVGVVGFNNDAWTGAPLSSDTTVILAALDGLSDGIQEGTRLDRALRAGQALLDGTPRAPGVEPVLVLLTDGLPNRVPTPIGGGRQEDTVLAAAAEAKAAGTRVFAIGLGESGDVFESLLQGIASSSGDYFLAPDGEDLAAIYRAIAGRLTGCPSP